MEQAFKEARKGCMALRILDEVGVLLGLCCGDRRS